MSHIGRARMTHHPYVYLFVCFTFLLTLADATSILFLPLYLSSVLKMEPIHIGVLSGIVPLAATLGGFLAGSLSDVLGRKPVLILSMFAYSVFMIGFALSKEPVLLFLFVFLKGFFSGFFSPVSKALMADVTPSEYRLKVFSLRYLVVNIAYALGPLIGLLADIGGSIESFYVAAAVYCILGVGLLVLIKQDTRHPASYNQSDKSSIVIACKVIYRDAPLLLFIIGGILSTVVHGQWSVPLMQYLGLQVNEPAKLFAIIVGVNSICVIVFQIPVTRIAQKFQPIVSVFMGSSIFALGMLGFAFANEWWHFVVSMVVFTMGEVLVIPAEYQLLDQITPAHFRGAYYGAQSFTTLGSFIGPWLGSVILTHFSSGGFFTFGTYGLIALLSVVFFWRGSKLHVKFNRHLALLNMQNP